MKIFAVSDIHSFFTPLKKELDKKGFEANNPEHLLVVCGDVFDRGSESREVYEYLNGLTNVILVKGNHESLMEEVWSRGYTLGHDCQNGTAQTIMDLFVSNPNLEPYDYIKVSEKILRPFFSKFVNYFETKNYIFVHGWIPCEKSECASKPWYLQNKLLEYNPYWRNCNDVEWEAARWINGIKAGYANSIIEPGKTVVCGHWHCSYGHMLKSAKTNNWISEFGEDAIWVPFEAEGVLAIDRCTAHTGEVNVVVLEDELLEEKDNKET
jgi:serine/threonine protein phosphatase 1